MEEPISLSDTEDFSLQDTSLMQASKDNQDYLIMTIELGDGQQQHLKIHSTDDPNQLAHDFIKVHNLNPELEQSLSSLIKQNLGLLDKRSQPSPFLKSSLSNYHSLTKDRFHFKEFDSPTDFNHTPEINKKSSMITSKQSRNGDIHERLYRLAKKKKSKIVTSTQSLSERSSNYFNTGEILYIKGMTMQHSKMRMIEEKNKAKLEQEAEELTFKPCINSKEIRHDEKLEDALFKKGKDYQEHKKALKEKYLKEEIKECSFKPNANKPKESCNKNIHEDLYKEANKRQEKQMELATKQLYSFEPNPNKPKSDKKTENKEQFINRLLTSKIKLNEEMEKLRALQDINHDIVTGQKLYSPITLNSSDTSIRKNGKVI